MASTVFEVWEKTKYDRGNNKPEDTFFVVDSAYDKVKDISRGKSHKQTVWNSKITTGNPWGGGWEELELPNVFIVIMKAKLVLLKAYGINGKLLFPKDCLRCGNTGNDTNCYGLPCAACGGACLMTL